VILWSVGELLEYRFSSMLALGRGRYPPSWQHFSSRLVRGLSGSSVDGRGGSGGNSKKRPLPYSSEEVAELCMRTNFTPDDIEDLGKRFQQKAGDKVYLTRDEFRQTARHSFGIMKEDWVAKYFKAFDRDSSDTIDFHEYVLGFAAMSRVLTDKKANSLLGFSTGPSIVREGRSAKLFWDEPPKRVGLIKKWKTEEVSKLAAELVEWLSEEKGLEVLLEPSVEDSFKPDCARFDPDILSEQVDFLVCLGGDGTVLTAANYFDDSRPIPPILAFGMGSLGFLAPFGREECKPLITQVLEAHRNPMQCQLRTRLRGELRSRSGELIRTFYSLNECIINRGLSGVLSTVDIYVDHQYVTTAQGDGLIIATPSGSTAYNVSAGGCMVSPLVPCHLITPIAPHSLSFRPILTSASSEITVRIPDDARASGWMSYDASESALLDLVSYLSLCALSSSPTPAMPLPTLSSQPLDGDWFSSIREKLHWNVRARQ
ncbi:unnamed protein product, partial [Chrysoparadoxa australica]